MSLGRLSDPEWWWEYALDGVAGAIISGLVTLLVLWLTFRHADQNRKRDELTAEVRALRLRCDEMFEQLTRGDPELFSAKMKMLSEINRLTMLAGSAYPRFSQLVFGWWQLIGEGGSGSYFPDKGLKLHNDLMFMNGLNCLRGDLDRWLGNPRFHEKMSKRGVEDLVATIKTAPGP